jgi:methyl-accepting chemotaxis protein
LIKNTENVKALKGVSEIGRTGLQDVASDIKEIAREYEGLMEINSVMENIASQTNLL